jgi:mannose-6-phosphate isomerase-like protein (cupin superfamily)
MTPVVNLRARAAELTAHWSPKVVAEVNGQYVKVAKLLGDFVWHAHEGEDELFQVLQGRLVIQYEGNRDVVLEAGDIHVVPRGVRHNPVAQEECLIALFEPAATLHTGDVVTERSRSIAEQLG